MAQLGRGTRPRCVRGPIRDDASAPGLLAFGGHAQVADALGPVHLGWVEQPGEVGRVEQRDGAERPSLRGLETGSDHAPLGLTDDDGVGHGDDELDAVTAKLGDRVGELERRGRRVRGVLEVGGLGEPAPLERGGELATHLDERFVVVVHDPDLGVRAVLAGEEVGPLPHEAVRGCAHGPVVASQLP